MSVFCYPQVAKLKSVRICEAFAQGCGGTVITDGQLRDGPAMFYGIAPGMEGLWKGVQDGRDWYFADNSYFDAARAGQRFDDGLQFRITKNRLQHDGAGTSTGERLKALGVTFEPWREGVHIVVCPQSDHFMQSMGYEGNWLADTVRRFKRETYRPLRVRPWLRDKREQASSLKDDLQGAHMLVTWTSAAAVNAVVAGVPVMCAQSAASLMASEDIENVRRPEREQWAAVLADNQFSLNELSDGTAWRQLAR